jgi:cell division protein FtsN
MESDAKLAFADSESVTMPQHERGLYEPGEDMRAFDGPEDEEEDIEGSRLPLLIVLALLVLAMFAGFVWLAYSEGVARGRSEAPVITAEAGPTRVAPQNPGGTAQPYQGFKVYEQPAPPDEDTAQNSAPAAAQSAKTASAPPAAMTKAPEPAAKAPAPAAKPPAPKVAAAAPKPAPAPVKSQARATEPPAAPAKPATAAPKTLNTASAAPAGPIVLQIGAYKSQADADTAWTIYKSKHAALLAGYSPNIEQADLGDKGTWYRLRIAGFSSRDVALALCDRLKADGGSCFLGK